MLTLGIIVLVAALVALVFYLKTSYETQGGGIGQVPVLGASIIQIPLLVMLGLNLINNSTVIRRNVDGWFFMLTIRAIPWPCVQNTSSKLSAAL